MNMRQSRVLRQMRSGKVATSMKLNLIDPRNADVEALCAYYKDMAQKVADRAIAKL